ncbi:hypothetical protein [Methylobacterium terrae]|uniref:hypothetical protein n=1 Tax=Methylobacterium terrae TaxID=2202827 RepID=UPI0013A54F5A|nr:hypothetical protein [Methylobacterium terrae]
MPPRIYSAQDFKNEDVMAKIFDECSAEEQLIFIKNRPIIFSGTSVSNISDEIEIKSILNGENYSVFVNFVYKNGNSISIKATPGIDGRNINMNIFVDWQMLDAFAFNDQVVIAISENSKYIMNLAFNFVESTNGKAVVLNFTIYEQNT